MKVCACILFTAVSDSQTGCWCVSRPATEQLEVVALLLNPTSAVKRISLSDCCVKSYLSPPPAELPLKMLTVKVGGSPTEAELITRVLQRAPHLTSFHLCGVRLAAGWSQAQLLTTLSGTVQGQQPPVARERVTLQTKGHLPFSTS